MSDDLTRVREAERTFGGPQTVDKILTFAERRFTDPSEAKRINDALNSPSRKARHRMLAVLRRAMHAAGEADQQQQRRRERFAKAFERPAAPATSAPPAAPRASHAARISSEKEYFNVLRKAQAGDSQAKARLKAHIAAK